MANSPFKNVPTPDAPSTSAPTPPVPEAPTANVTPSSPAVPDAPPVKANSDQVKKTRSTPITKEDINFVRNNIKTMKYQEIADAREISKSQVNRVLQFIREGIRKQAIDVSEKRGEQPYGMKEQKTKNGVKEVKDYDNPLTPEAQKAEAYIQEHYSRPESAGAGGGGQVKEALDDTLNDILNDLNLDI